MVVTAVAAGPADDDENAALVSSRRSHTYTMENCEEQPPTPPRQPSSSDPLEYAAVSGVEEGSLLSQFHEDAIKQAGLGSFQWLLLLVAGLGLAADSVEVFVVFYILPSAEVEMCITQTEKDWMGAITFVGMMVGATLWGNLADRMGRRRTLLSALGVNAGFSVIAAFMPTYGTFMTARFCSAVGVGGSLPVAYAYYSEFLPRAERGRYLGGLNWNVLLGLQVAEDSSEHFSAWHQFLLLCTLPCFAAIIGLIFSPESPRHLLEAGLDVEAMLVYQRIYKLSELELPTKRAAGLGGYSPGSPGKSVLADMTYSIEMVGMVGTVVITMILTFVDTDLWWGDLPDEDTGGEIWLGGENGGRFQRCHLVNNSILSLSPGCHLDFDYNIHLQDVFQENLVGQLALLPGALVCAFLVDRVGRTRIITVSMFLSALTAPFIWLLDTGAAIIAFEAVFNLLFVAGWSSLAVATLESYPTHLRWVTIVIQCPIQVWQLKLLLWRDV
ncbi:hypothetical protein B566_EDAN015921 [Ephemera danica]|nr:hypothetical protein B566_EDAN015921 [Ephemera danica]